MTDSLDSLTDAQLSEAFAVEVAGWKRKELPSPHIYSPDGKWMVYDKIGFATFATSADAVLPFLVEPERLHIERMFGRLGWRVSISDYQDLDVMCEAPTFAKAACIALIRAKRAAK